MRKLTEILTVERVKAAYERTGLRPCRAAYYTDAEGNDIKDVSQTPACACPIGAVIYDRFGRIPDANLLNHGPDNAAASLLANLDLESNGFEYLSPTEVSYFVNGVDGEVEPPASILNPETVSNNPAWVEAFKRGQEIRKAVGL